MKKLNIFAGLMLGLVAMVATSCDSDRDNNPVLQEPTTFKLNTPALSEQSVEITEGSTVSLSWSQPDYGFPAITDYYIQVGEMHADSTITWNVDESGNARFLSTTFNTCTASVPSNEIAEALCQIDGVEDESQYVDMGYRQIAFRVCANLHSAADQDPANPGIFSNAVVFSSLKSFCYISKRGQIYLVGSQSGWAEPSADNAETYANWALTETEVHSRIYTGTFTIPAGTFSFRFFSKLEGWGATNGIAAGEEDMTNISINSSVSDGIYTGSLTAPGQSNWQYDDFAGGTVKFTVDLNASTVRFEFQ